MGLADRLNSARKPPGLPCGMGQIIQQLKEQEKTEDLQALEAVLDTRRQGERQPGYITNHQLTEALKQEGFNIAFASVRQHRRKECRCFVSVYLQN